MTTDSTVAKTDVIDFRIVGVDPGFKHVGLSLMVHRVRLADNETETLLEDVFHLETKKDVRDGVTQKQDDRRRLHEIGTAFYEVCADFKPHIFSFEDFPFVRNARSSVQIALAWAACFTLAKTVVGAAVLVFDPMEIKEAVTGNRTAEKIDVIRAVMEKYPDSDVCEVDRLGSKEYVNDVSHAADAVGAGIAASRSGKVRIAVQEWRRRAGLQDAELRKVISDASKPTRLW